MLTREEWIEALRSGKYPQTKGILHNEEGFCCLGVACDLKNPNLWEREISWQNGEPVFYYSWDSMMSLLPDYLREELNITDLQMTDLTHLNDAGVSFKVIADLIEKNLPHQEVIAVLRAVSKDS